MTNKDLLRIRHRLGKTQKEFAEFLGYSLSYYQKLEEGTHKISKDFLDVLYSALNIEEKSRKAYIVKEEKKPVNYEGLIWFLIVVILAILILIEGK